MGQQKVMQLTVALQVVDSNTGAVMNCLYVAGSITIAPKNRSKKSTLNDRQAYLIVAPPAFRNTLRPFMDWKQQEGYIAEPLWVDNVDRDVLRQQLRQRWQQTSNGLPVPKYLLLVGDANIIPPFAGLQQVQSLGAHVTDLYYAEYTGDAFPEVIVGRIPVDDTLTLTHIIHKTLAYEQGTLSDTSYLNRILLVAGREARYPAPLTTNSQIQQLAQMAKCHSPHIDTLCYRNPDSDSLASDIVQQLRQGAGLINFTGHCLSTSWQWPTLNVAEVVDTHGRPAVMVNNCCDVSNFTTAGMASALLKMPNGGIVGNLGALHETLWYEDHLWSLGWLPNEPLPTEESQSALASLLPCPPEANTQFSVQTLGEMMKAGNTAVTTYGSAFADYYWENYNVMGDPALRPYIGTPKQGVLNLLDSAVVGQTLLRARTVAGGRVAAVQNSVLIGCAIADSTGLAQLTLDQPLDSTALLITSTRLEYKPMTIYTTPQVDTHSHLTLLSWDSDTTDSQLPTDSVRLHMRWYNNGHATAHHIDIILTVDGPMQPSIAMRIESLSPQADTLLTTSIPIPHNHTDSYLPVHITAHEGTRLHTQLTLPLSMPRANPEVCSARLTTNGRPLRQMLQHEPMTVQLIVRNIGSALMPADTVVCEAASGATMLSSRAGCRALRPEESDTIHFDIMQDELDVIVLHVAIGNRDIKDTLLFVPRGATETFENSALSGLPWTVSTSTPWIIDLNTAHSGQQSTRSASLRLSQQSCLSLDMECSADDSLSFWLRTEGCNAYDAMHLEVDDAERGAWSRTHPWKQYKVRLSAGRHSINWYHRRLQTDTACSTTAWIDDVVLPLCCLRVSHVNVEIDSNPTPLSQPSIPEESFPLVIAPNPASQLCTITNRSTSPLQLYLYSMQGQRLTHFTLSPTSATPLDIRHLPEGLYLILYSTPDGTTVTQRLVIAR